MKRMWRRWLERKGYQVRRLPTRWAPWGDRLLSKQDDWFDRTFEAAEPDPRHRSRLKSQTNSKICRCWMLKSLLETLLPLEHDVAECGVNRGLSAYVLAEYLQRSGFAAPRRLQLFDTFEGTPEVDAAKDDATSIVAGTYATPYEYVVERFRSYPFVDVVAGRIPESLGPAAERTFAFLHLDLNIYEAYRDALNFFWPRLAVPGIVVCDDYGFPGSRGASLAVDEFAAAHAVKAVYLPTGQAALWKFRA